MKHVQSHPMAELESMPNACDQRRGFTLIELSIVLVIIGLIVGGLLVGRDLINAAAIRSTIGQYNKFNAAVNTFRLKYDGLPGDLARTKAITFGFPYTPAAHPANNNNRIIIESQYTPFAQELARPAGEVLFFWRYLSVDTKLIAGEYSSHFIQGLNESTPAANSNPLCGSGRCPMSAYFPAAKIKSGTYWVVGSNLNANFYGLMATETTAMTGGFYENLARNKALTPLQAFAIDTKIDNGMPNTGNIQARGEARFMAYSDTGFELTADLSATNAASYAATPVSGTCQTGGASSTDTANVYATNSAFANVPACNMRLKLQ